MYTVRVIVVFVVFIFGSFAFICGSGEKEYIGTSGSNQMYTHKFQTNAKVIVTVEIVVVVSVCFTVMG